MTLRGAPATAPLFAYRTFVEASLSNGPEGVLLPAMDFRAPAANGGSPTLTPRERQIVEMLARGATGDQIAQQLVLSPETVQKHVHNAKRKLGAATRAHLIALALTRGLIDPAVTA